MKEKLYQILTSNNIIEEIKNNEEFLFLIIPELKNEVSFLHNHPHHHLDVYNHTLLALSNSESDFEIRLILLLHDIGKPFSYQDEETIRHFKDHALKSKEMSKIILNRLGYDNSFINRILYLIENHDELIDVNNIEDRELEIKRLKVQYADALAHSPSTINKRLTILNEVSNIICPSLILLPHHQDDV